jgi:hypothetical protein
MATHNIYDVGDVAVLSYVLVDASGTAYQPADPGGVVCRVYNARGTLVDSFWWLAAGGGDEEIVNDSVGHFHVDYPVTRQGDQVYEFQAYSIVGALNVVVAADSIERQTKHFIGRA